MNDQAAMAKLAAAIPEWAGLTDDELPMLAVALIPAVREIAADELRAAYIENRTTVAKLSPVEKLTCLIVKMEDLVVRADHLDGKTP